MNTLNLQDKKVVKSTATLVRTYIRENFSIISKDMLFYYDLVAGLIEKQITKPVAQRMSIPEILERSYNFEKLFVEQGGAEFIVETI